MRRRFGILVSTVLVLTVVAGLLLMHGFEAVSPETLATHAVDDAQARSAMLTVGMCVFVSANAVSIATTLPFVTSLIGPVRRPAGGSRSFMALVLRGPPGGFSYERCVIRV